jgi:hypothetical protein
MYLDLSLPIRPFIFCHKPISAPENTFYSILTSISSHVYHHSILSPVGVRIRDATLDFNVL